MDTNPTIKEVYLKQEVCDNRSFTCTLNEQSNYPECNENVNLSFTQLEVKDEHITVVKLENLSEAGAIKREAEDTDVNISETISTENDNDTKLEPLVQEEVDIKEENELHNTKLDTKGKSFVCDVCGKRFLQKYKLHDHIRTHTGEKPFACHVCDYKYSNKNSLRYHIKTHTGGKRFACDVCDYKCLTKGHLRNHIRIHTGEKPFACDVCDYKCSQSTGLRNHMRTHTGEKPYACDMCDYKCSNTACLYRHMKTHTREKIFASDVCNYKGPFQWLLGRGWLPPG